LSALSEPVQSSAEFGAGSQTKRVQQAKKQLGSESNCLTTLGDCPLSRL
jgi:hypothetical protein